MGSKLCWTGLWYMFHSHLSNQSCLIVISFLLVWEARGFCPSKFSKKSQTACWIVNSSNIPSFLAIIMGWRVHKMSHQYLRINLNGSNSLLRRLTQQKGLIQTSKKFSKNTSNQFCLSYWCKIFSWDFFLWKKYD